MPLSTQKYKWILANLMLGGNPAMDYLVHCKNFSDQDYFAYSSMSSARAVF